MPIYQYECACGKQTERITPISQYQDEISCPHCGEPARRTFAPGSHYCGNQDASWLKSVLEVVDKSDAATPAEKEFRKNPTRWNYKQWMKSRGLRPLEKGERSRPTPPDMSRVNRQVAENHFNRKAISIRSR